MENITKVQIRTAEVGDLQPLLELYLHLHETSAPPVTSALERQWAEMLEDRRLKIIVAQEGAALVSSCTLDLVPNLTRGQRPYGVIENVVTAAHCRGRGLATACLDYARELARAAGCYKLMLLTGAKDEETLGFYERAGYNRQDKTGLIQWLEEGRR